MSGSAIKSGSTALGDSTITATAQAGDASIFTQLLNESAAEDFHAQLFEQYKLYVELTDRISQRRATSNTFFISANAALLTVATWFKDDFGSFIVFVSAVGVTISLIWFFSIKSYSQLNKGKFSMIHEMEKYLPLNLYKVEWEVLGKGKSRRTYWPLSNIERVVPFVFAGLYIALSLFVLLIKGEKIGYTEIKFAGEIVPD
jgi:hypothetical protein